MNAKDWGLETISKAVQVLSVVIGGAWVLYQYMQHTNEQERLRTQQLELSNEQQRIANAQVTALAAAERETKLIGLKQQEASLRQFELTASTEAERAKTLLAQQRFSLQQNKLLADSELRKQELAVQSADIDNRLKGATLKLNEQSRVSASHDLEVKCEPDGKYYGTFKISVQNTASIDVELTIAVNHKFIGALSGRQASLAPTLRQRPTGSEAAPPADFDFDIAVINPPPIPIAGRPSVGRVNWRSVGGQAYYYPSSKHGLPKLGNYDWLMGGGGTKLLRPGDKSEYEEPFLITAVSGSWVGVSHTIGIDGAKDGDSIFNFYGWKRLPKCDGPALGQNR
jgi:hypothetical protein